MQLEQTGSFAVPPFGFIRIMLSAVRLDDKTRAKATEVRNLLADRDLPPEMRILEFNAMPQRPP